MANPRKPRALKVLQGTNRPSRDRPEPEFPPADDVQQPDWLSSPDAVAEWKRLVPLLKATRVLTQGDLTTLGHLCNLHGDCVKLYRAGLSPLAAQLTQLRLYLAEFGLTPASRAKAAPAGAGKKANPFKALEA